jgi:hypothetical protein
MNLKPLTGILIIAAATLVSILGCRYWDNVVAFGRGVFAGGRVMVRPVPPSVPGSM